MSRMQQIIKSTDGYKRIQRLISDIGGYKFLGRIFSDGTRPLSSLDSIDSYFLGKEVLVPQLSTFDTPLTLEKVLGRYSEANRIPPESLLVIQWGTKCKPYQFFLIYGTPPSL